MQISSIYFFTYWNNASYSHLPTVWKFNSQSKYEFYSKTTTIGDELSTQSYRVKRKKKNKNYFKFLLHKLQRYRKSVFKLSVSFPKRQNKGILYSTDIKQGNTTVQRSKTTRRQDTTITHAPLRWSTGVVVLSPWRNGPSSVLDAHAQDYQIISIPHFHRSFFAGNSISFWVFFSSFPPVVLHETTI